MVGEGDDPAAIWEGLFSGANCLFWGGHQSWLRGPFDCNLGIFSESFSDDMTDMTS